MVSMLQQVSGAFIGPKGIMKKLLISFLVVTGVAHATSAKFPKRLIQEIEAKYLEKYKNLSDSQKQEKYLIAISELAELGDYEGAITLAESGYKLKHITLDYYDLFLSLLRLHGTKERYNEVFNDLFHENFRTKNEEEKSVLGDIILDYMLLNSIFSHELKPRIENVYKSISESTFKSRSQLVQSIIYAKKTKYKEALALIKPTQYSGLEELLYYAFLQKMNGLPLTSKSPTLSNIYKDLIALIETTDKEKLVETLKGHGDILEESPLYEVLK